MKIALQVYKGMRVHSVLKEPDVQFWSITCGGKDYISR